MQTAIVDLEQFNRALVQLQNLSGEVSFLKVLPIIQGFQQSIVPQPDEKTEEKCRSDTPQKSSSKRSATGQ